MFFGRDCCPGLGNCTARLMNDDWKDRRAFHTVRYEFIRRFDCCGQFKDQLCASLLSLDSSRGPSCNDKRAMGKQRPFGRAAEDPKSELLPWISTSGSGMRAIDAVTSSRAGVLGCTNQNMTLRGSTRLRRYVTGKCFRDFGTEKPEHGDMRVSFAETHHLTSIVGMVF